MTVEMRPPTPQYIKYNRYGFSVCGRVISSGIKLDPFLQGYVLHVKFTDRISDPRAATPNHGFPIKNSIICWPNNFTEVISETEFFIEEMMYS